MIGIALFLGSIFVNFELRHHYETIETLNKNRNQLTENLSVSNVDYSHAEEYFKKCNDEESKLILCNITNKSFISKKVLHKSLSYYCNHLTEQLDNLLNILHKYHDFDTEHDDDDFIRLSNRSFVIRIPCFLSAIINLFNYGVTYHLKTRKLIPVDHNHNVYMRYRKENKKTIIIFSGIVGGRLIIARLLKYIPDDYNIIGTVYEEISSKFYEDVVYDILVEKNLTDNIALFSWSYGTLFANKFVEKYKNNVNIKLKVFCDIFGLPLNTLYMANICGTDNLMEAYRLIKLKVRPFWNGIMMLLLLKSEYIEKRIMTLTLNDYIIWSYENMNTDNTLMFISNDDIMYNVDRVKLHCPNAEIHTFEGGHCRGVNRRSLLMMKKRLLEM